MINGCNIDKGGLIVVKIFKSWRKS